MATATPEHAQLASQARQLYADELIRALPAVVKQVSAGARDLLDKPARRASTSRGCWIRSPAKRVQ